MCLSECEVVNNQDVKSNSTWRCTATEWLINDNLAF